jgi:chlorite dismutase
MARERDARQFVQFVYYRIDPAWRRLPAAEREAHKRAFQGVVEQFAERMILRTYTLVGLRGDADFMLWNVSAELETFIAFSAELNATGLGGYLTRPYSYLSQTKRSMYVDKHRHAGQEGSRLRITPGTAKYLFVYPFVKTRAWYALSKERRQEMMDTHIAIGHTFPSVKLNTTYSYGLDDQEFVLAFESDYPGDFLDLVMALRETEASMYTERDTPIFTCAQVPAGEMLDLLG